MQSSVIKNSSFVFILFELQLFTFIELFPHTIPKFRRWSREKEFNLWRTLSAPNLNALFNAPQTFFASSSEQEVYIAISSSTNKTQCSPLIALFTMYAGSGVFAGEISKRSSLFSSSTAVHARECLSPLLSRQEAHLSSPLRLCLYTASLPQRSVLHFWLIFFFLIWLSAVQISFIWLKAVQICWKFTAIIYGRKLFCQPLLRGIVSKAAKTSWVCV